MPIDFPDTPFVGQQFTAAGKTWEWNGYAWDAITVQQVGATGPAPNGTGIVSVVNGVLQTPILAGSLSVGSASAAVVNDNNVANREFFPVFAYQSAGTATTLYGSSTKLKFNPSNGYFTADGGFIANNGDLGIYSSGVHWANGLVFDAETNSIFPNNSGVAVASWTSANGMYVTGTASKDVPLRLMDGNAANLATGAYIIVRPSASATANGTELRNAYAAAKAFTPNTAALSATNRATVILLPGRYDLGTTPLTMDTEFVDLVGLSGDPKHAFITSQVVLSDNGTIIQTADDVIIKNVSIDRTGSPQGVGAGRAAAYFPQRAATNIQSWTSNGTTATVTSNGHGLSSGDSVRITSSGGLDGVYTVSVVIDQNSFTFNSTVNSSGVAGAVQERFDNTYIENCRFSGFGGSAMRRAVEYSGTYKKCFGDGATFGTDGSIASGLFEDCVSTDSSFGAGNGSIASGTFIRCSGGSYSFGANSGGNPTFATGIFEDCTMTSNASYNGTFTGTMRRCRFVCTGTNNNALNVGAGAKIFDSTLIATGTGNSITAGSAVTISLAGCRMNNSINANVSNNLGTLTESYNLIDSDIN